MYRFYNSIKKIVMIFVGLLILSCYLQAEDTLDTFPNSNKKFRIAYYEGGSYRNFPANLVAIVNALSKMGWLDKITIPYKNGSVDAEKIWDYISNNTQSEHIEFISDAFYSSNWSKKLRITNKQKILNRLNTKKDIDLILAFGTWAGQDLSAKENKTPTIVISVSDPIKSNIIKSVEDSGHDNIHATVDPTLYQRQVNMFYEIIKFKKLGMVYENTIEGRSYAALDDVKKVAKKHGFKIVSCIVKEEDEDGKKTYENISNCYEKVAKKSDAVYVTEHSSINLNDIKNLAKIFINYKIPSFSQSDSEEVREGILLSMAQADFKYIGEFYASTIAKILNGAKPRSLKQLFENPSKVAINLLTAKKIGYDPSIELMGITDEIYQYIGKREF